MTIVFTAGGTGGHIYPAIAIAEELKSMNDNTEIMFISGTRDVERSIISKSGFASETIRVSGMPRKLSSDFPAFFWKMGVATVRSRRFLKKAAPDCMLATGGYVSVPPVLAARSLGIPVFLQEQNSFPGIATRHLARFADTIFLGFSDAIQYLGAKSRNIVTGNPVRRGINAGDQMKAAEKYGLEADIPTVLVFGGSQGARRVNEVVSQVLSDIVEKGYQLIWQTGGTEYKRWADKEIPGKTRIVPYIEDMADVYAMSNVVVARSGAMTIAELAVSGLPAILIPLPTAAGNHQEFNARSMVDASAGVMILENDLNKQTLSDELFQLLDNEERRTSMKMAARAVGNRNAARDIATYILNRFGMN